MTWLARLGLRHRRHGRRSEPQVFGGLDSPLTSVACSADARLAITGAMGGGREYAELAAEHPDSGESGGDEPTDRSTHVPVRRWLGGAVLVWSLPRGKCTGVLQGHRQAVRAVDVDGRGRVAVSAGDDHTAFLWDLRRRKPLRSLDTWGTLVAGLCLTPDGQQVVAACADGVLRVWDLPSDRTRALIEPNQAEYPLLAVALQGEGRAVVTGGEEGVVRVWDRPTHSCVHRLYGHAGAVTAVAAAGVAQLAASGGADGRVRIWDLRSGACVRELPGHSGGVTALAVSPDGGRVVSAGVSSGKALIRIWDVKANALAYTFRGHRKAVSAIRLLPDGHRAVSVGHDGTVQVWGM